MAFDVFVPEGKTLETHTGGYKFVGPCRAKLSAIPCPAYFTDGTPVQQTGEVQAIAPEKLTDNPVPHFQEFESKLSEDPEDSGEPEEDENEELEKDNGNTE